MDRKRKILLFTINAVLIVIIFGAVTYRQLSIGDFQPHLQWARQLGESSYLYLRANLLFQRLVLVVRDLLPFNFFARTSKLLQQIIDIKSYDISAFIVMIVAYLFTFYYTFRFFSEKFVGKDTFSNKILLSICSYVSMLLGPIILFSYPERQYLGYINGNPFHNPTYLLMRPLALLFFIFTLNALYKRTDWKQILIASGVLVLATLAKPNFTLSFIPAIFIVAILNYRRIGQLNYRFLFFACIVTPVIVLMTQYFLMYTGNRGDRVLITPFTAILSMVPNITDVIVSFLLSMAFCTSVLIGYWSKVKSNIAVQLGLVNFFISIFYAYGLSEQVDMQSLNFWWTPMMGLYLLSLIMISILFNEVYHNILEYKKIKLKNYILLSVLLLHLVSGIVFYCSSLGPMNVVQVMQQ